MGWSIRKFIASLAGREGQLVKEWSRISLGVPGMRASVDMKGKARVYGGIGPLRYQRSVDVAGEIVSRSGVGQALRSLARRIVNR